MKQLLIACALLVTLSSCSSMDPRPLTESELLAVDSVVEVACDAGSDGLAKLLSEHPEYLPAVVGLASVLPAAFPTK